MNRNLNHHHFLIIALPAQGHLNPTLQLTKNLTRAGARVTFATTIYGKTQLKILPNLDGLSYVFFSDGMDDEESRKNGDFFAHMESLKNTGAAEVTRLIQTLAVQGRSVTMVIYGILLPWVAVVAREFNIPSAFFAVQSATVYAIYQQYFHRQCHGGEITENIVDPSLSIKIPNLPVFSSRDLPSILLPSSRYFAFAAVLQQHIKNLEDDPKPCVLINTFDDLEIESIKAIEKIEVISVGPLIPSAFADGIDPSDKSFGCDLFEAKNRGIDYLQWLDSKPARSVIYVSFGSLAVVKKEQKVEILGSLLESGKPFLWIIRGGKDSDDEDEAVKAAIEEGAIGEGIIMPWCSQIGVLSHQSIGCFISHCGWNSTLESLVAGVPILGCPRFSDQMTNAKMVEEVWGIGVRANDNGEDGVVEREEIKKCLDILMGGGERGKEIEQNAVKWRGLALKAVKEGGSSYHNLKALLENRG